MLSNTQIKQLFDFTRRKRVRYKDVQIEIVDHLATAIEEKQQENPDLSFEKALDQVYAGFGIFGFAKIVQAKETGMQKFWQRRIFQKIMTYYRIPRIVGTLGFSYLLYIGLNLNGWLTIKMLFVALMILSFSAIVWIGYKNYTMDREIRDFLYVKSYYGMVGFFFLLIFQTPNFWMPGIGELIVEPGSVATILISLFVPFSVVLFYICMVEIPKELWQEFHEKYGKYLELI